MQLPKNTVAYIMADELSVNQAVDYLIRESKWFEVTPLPDDDWRIVVKDEGGSEYLAHWGTKTR